MADFVGEFVDGQWRVVNRDGEVVAAGGSLAAVVSAIAPDVSAEGLALLEQIGQGEGRTCNLRPATAT